MLKYLLVFVIHPIIENFGPEYSNFMFGGEDRFKKLVNNCLDMNKAYHTYFQDQVRYELLRISNFIHKLYKFCNTIIFFLCSVKSELTGIIKGHK